jgi:hypothetical protein
MLYFRHMDKDTKDILEAVNFIKDHMVTKDDLREELKPIRSELKSIRDELDDLTDKLENVSGFPQRN